MYTGRAIFSKVIINLVPSGLFCYIIYLGLPVLAGSPQQHMTSTTAGR